MRTLSRQELRRLRDFIASPYFNKRAVVQQLGTVLIELALRDFPPSKTTATYLYQQLFPRKAFDEKQYAYLLSDVQRLTEQFLTHEWLKAEKHTLTTGQLRTFSERGLAKSYRAAQRRSDQQSLQALLSIQELWQRYRVAQIAEDQFAQTGSRKEDPYLQRAADQLDTAYWTSKLRLSCAMYTRQVLLKESFTIRYLETLMNYAPEQLPNDGLLCCYLAAYRLLQSEDDEEQLLAFASKLEAFRTVISTSEQQELFLHATNYCIRQIRQGKRRFVAHLLQLYDQGLTESYLLDEGVLSPWNYKNIVRLSLSLHRYEWVEQFVETYTSCLPKEEQADAYHYNMALIMFSQQKYAAATNYLHQTAFSDVHYVLGAKTLLIKIYYVTDAQEALLSLLHSFRSYLLRNRLLTQSAKAPYLNFVRLTQRVYYSNDEAKRIRVRQLIADTSSLTERSWLQRLAGDV
ncbi:MAG: hypothetical protein AAGJ82_02810 [Bacteroidota bacterium]